MVDGIPYKFTVDLRTGFYIADIHRDVRKLNYSMKPIRMTNADRSVDPQIVPFYFPREYKQKIHASLTKNTTEESLEHSLNNIYASYSKHYQFNRGDPDAFRSVYKMEIALPRPDLNKPMKRFTRKAKKTVPKQI